MGYVCCQCICYELECQWCRYKFKWCTLWPYLSFLVQEELKKIHNWQYINCLKLWVKFITCNFRDNDFQQLIVSLIRVITGVAHLFHGPRYLPLRLKCVQMLNELSLSCGVFIPIASLLFDFLDYREPSSMNEASGKRMSFPSLLKVSGHLLYSATFIHVFIILFSFNFISFLFTLWYRWSLGRLLCICLVINWDNF